MKKNRRNDPCPCGSGKKFKHCCGGLNMAIKLKDDFMKIMSENDVSTEASEAIYYLLKYIEDTPWNGACHAVSSVLYVVLTEAGYKVVLCIGEVDSNASKPFDHSWIELNEKILDLTIHKGLAESNHNGPIIMDIRLEDLKPHNIRYGFDFVGLGNIAHFALDTEFTEYMDKFPRPTGGGLWSYIRTMYGIAGMTFDLDLLRNKYRNTKREIISKN